MTAIDPWTEACGRLCKRIRKRGYLPAVKLELEDPSCQEAGLMVPWSAMISNLLAPEGEPAVPLVFPDMEPRTFACGRCQDQLYLLREVDGVVYSRKCHPCLAWDRIYIEAERKGGKTIRGSISEDQDPTTDRAPRTMPRLGMFSDEGS
ncbi:MAG: hypothetical protein V3S82_10305 [Dehalococcoidia bacterium]